MEGSEVPGLEPSTSQFQSKNDTTTQKGLKQKRGRIACTIYLIYLQISRILSIMIEIEDFCILFIVSLIHVHQNVWSCKVIGLHWSFQ